MSKKFMKRPVVRLSILIGVVAVGLFAIARGQFFKIAPESATAEETTHQPTEQKRSPIEKPIVATKDDLSIDSVVSGDAVSPYAEFEPISVAIKSPIPAKTPKAIEAAPIDVSSRPVGAILATGTPTDTTNTKAAPSVSVNDVPVEAKSIDGDDLAIPPVGSLQTPSSPELPPETPFEKKESPDADPYDHREANVVAIADPSGNKFDPAFNKSQPAGGITEKPPVAVPRSAIVEQYDSSAMKASTNATDTRAAAGEYETAAKHENTDATGKPGDVHLEGQQAPSLVIQKKAPAKTQVGKPAVFEITIENRGKVAARGVRVVDQVPKGTQLISTKPTAEKSRQAGALAWELGTIKPGESKTIRIELMPLVEGTIGSVASVYFRADASAKSVVTKPRLVLEVSAPKKAQVGDDVEFSITLSNLGSGEATGVILESDVPQGLEHEAGSELEFEIGSLKPNEVRRLKLVMTAKRAGLIINRLIARGDGSAVAETDTRIQLVAPLLQISLDGPKKRYLERPATYTVQVANPGSAAAKDVELVMYLPKGMKFVKANNQGNYDTEEHAVFWSLEELPASRSGPVQLTVLPMLAGDLKLKVVAKAQKDLSDSIEKTVRVEGIAALSFQILDVQDPIEIGGEAVYNVRVINRGTKSATNIRLDAFLPRGIQGVGAKGPTAHEVIGQQQFEFAPLARLAPKAEVTYTIRAVAKQVGDHRIRVELRSDGMQRPVTQEESTRVFADE